MGAPSSNDWTSLILFARPAAKHPADEDDSRCRCCRSTTADVVGTRGTTAGAVAGRSSVSGICSRRHLARVARMSGGRIEAGAIAGGVTAVLLIAAVSGQHPASRLDALGYTLVVLGGLVSAAHRRAPLPVLAVTGLCVLGYQAIGFEVPAVAFLVAVYATVRAGHRLVAVAGSVLMVATLPFA